jgi:hypothetical protein
VCVREGQETRFSDVEEQRNGSGMRRGRRLMQLLEESFALSMEQWVLSCDYVEEQRRALMGFAGLWGGWR